MKRGPKDHSTVGTLLSRYREADAEVKHCDMLLQSVPNDRDLLERILIAETEMAHIRGLLACLNEDERRLIEAVYIGGRSLESASEVVPCSARTARRMKRRCFDKIEKQLTK